MCGRYFIGDPEELYALRQIIDEINRRAIVDVKTSGEVFPTDTVPVLATRRSREPGAFAMRWGYAMPDGRSVINARSETAREKPLFRDGMRQRRCAVPATRYFEWAHHSRAKEKYAIQPRGEPLFFLAGVYRLEQGRPEFCVLTRSPAPEIGFIHDRMPVMLPPELARGWIDPDVDASAMLERALTAVDFAPVAQAEADAQLRMQWD